jgi:hypothetical protein
VVSKSGIQMFMHFCYKFWRKLESTGAKWNSNRTEHVHSRDVAPRRATSASSPYRRVRTPKQARDRRSEAGLRKHYVPTRRDTLPAPRLVLCGRRSHAHARAAILH